MNLALVLELCVITDQSGQVRVVRAQADPSANMEVRRKTRHTWTGNHAEAVGDPKCTSALN
eukprot:scaffold82583_cov60-Phaeocystis_antarctica.AAC.1